MRVLLLTASYGDGHRQVAVALSQAFAQVGVEVVQVDCIAPVRAGRWSSEWFYDWTTRVMPGIYGFSYRVTRNLPARHPLWRMLSIPLRPVVRKALETYRPDAVIQLFPERVLLDMPASLRNVWTGMVITDYSIHRRWFHDGVAAYFVPDQRLVEAMKPLAHQGAAVLATGIPLREQFVTRDTDADIPPGEQPYVLVATGGRGLFPDLERTIREVVSRFPDHRIYVMCGKNVQMFDRVEQLKEQFAQVVPLSFLHEVAPWYRHAAFAIVKSGGLTVSECFATGCPMLLFRPQPGQEADNASFVAQLGAGRVAQTWEEMRHALEIFAREGERVRMARACRDASHPNAAAEVARHVLAQLQK
ncbi:hypothetical protein JI721_14655 [Alicyclobacillus cycloheptanicus]|uniref:Processive 1,2-diacylglycerol beta-glucosyltransferase n=1 Tax=Alicyclobacillus cycloheptanicus TaxID=1457 RepID=A0ABT9XL36_9BACL|nr:glycosyltransferase [Alicyclobacillus cycloheptanicus]MDQ0191016.1 processive 1,2-diacylglycerol beta-glucosyltransferase [Alicyclobacillus cycloheptanicus]WDM00908.1 hypothetical protein JI721_14655 [Alicyclobacillus cycloheptanicus]